jgi:hypothetical protein
MSMRFDSLFHRIAGPGPQQNLLSGRPLARKHGRESDQRHLRAMTPPACRQKPPASASMPKGTPDQPLPGGGTEVNGEPRFAIGWI